MSDKYRVSFKSKEQVHYLLSTFETELQAKAAIESFEKLWADIFVFTIVPPYEPPAIVAEDDLTAQAGSRPPGLGDPLEEVLP